MPQTNLRSFIMCDDPRGVVESKAIKKQKNVSKSSTVVNGGDHPWKGKEERKGYEDKMNVEMGFNASSSLQLLRVSRRIQKLNNTIESWSKGFSYESKARPNDIAKDLLRGALDLEESLAMLGKIQEDSQENMKSSSHRKEGRGDVKFQRSMWDRFTVRNMEKVRDEVPSRDCYEELRKVIRESLVQQNLWPETMVEKNQECGSKCGVSSSGDASMSSSRTCTVHGNDSDSTKSSFSSDIPSSGSVKGPNLIARLMGLDGLPVTCTDKTAIKKPSSKRHDLMLTENLETEQCKVIVGRNSVNEIALKSSPPYLLRSGCPKEIPTASPSTIVLIKPLPIRQPKTEAKARTQREIHPRMISQRKHRTESNITSNKNLVKKKNADGKDRHRSHVSLHTPPHNDAAPNKLNNSTEISTARRTKMGSRMTCEHIKVGGKKGREAKRLISKKKPNKHDNEGHDLASESNSVSSGDTFGSVNEHSAEKDTTSFKFHIPGHDNNIETSSCNNSMQHSHEDENQETITNYKHHDVEISLKSFLSSSPTFLSYAENLFNVKTNSTRSSTSSSTKRNNYDNNIVISDQILTLDCAKEVITRKSLQLWQSNRSEERLCISIDELLKEVCEGFEVLRTYRNMFSGQNYVSESVNMMLEKDLKGEMWDLGWRNGFRVYDTYQVVIAVESLILLGLIEEILL